MKNNRIFIYGTGLTLVLAMFVGCGGGSGEKEFEKAKKAWESGNLVQARTLFEKAAGRLAGNARKSMAFNSLGQVLWELGEPAAAANAFSDACTLSETITDARLNLALAQFHAGDLDAARTSINMYLGENPKNEAALALQSLIAAKKRDWAQSVRLMSDAAACDPNDPAAQNALALAELNHNQNSAQAITRLKQILAAHPDYAPALYNLGAVYDFWLHDGQQASSYYQDYLRKAGSEGSHAAAASNAIDRLNKLTAAVSGNENDAVQFMKEGTRLLEARQYAQAVDLFQKTVQADPTQKNAYYNMGLAYYSLGKYSNAAEACSSALGIDPRFTNARHTLVLVNIQQKKWDAAEREARELSKVDAKLGADMLNFIKANRN